MYCQCHSEEESSTVKKRKNTTFSHTIKVPLTILQKCPIMASRKREPNEARSKTDTSGAHRLGRATLAKRTPKPNESTTASTKMATLGATTGTSNTAATPVRDQNAAMLATPVTNVLTEDVPKPTTTVSNNKTSTFKISFYALRYFNNCENAKLQAVFGPKLVQDFKEISRLTNGKEQVHIPSLFQLSTDIQIDVDNIPYIVFNKVRHRCTEFYLQIEKPARILSSSKFNELARRSINKSMPLQQFLFDLQFPRNADSVAPGKPFQYYVEYIIILIFRASKDCFQSPLSCFDPDFHH